MAEDKVVAEYQGHRLLESGRITGLVPTTKSVWVEGRGFIQVPTGAPEGATREYVIASGYGASRFDNINAVLRGQAADLGEATKQTTAAREAAKRNAGIEPESFQNNPNAIINETDREAAIEKAETMKVKTPEQYKERYSPDYRESRGEQPKDTNKLTYKNLEDSSPVYSKTAARDTYKLTYKNLEDSSPVYSKTAARISPVIQSQLYMPGDLSKEEEDKIIAQGREADQLAVASLYGDQGLALVRTDWGKYSQQAPGYEKAYRQSIITLETTGKAYFPGLGDMSFKVPKLIDVNYSDGTSKRMTYKMYEFEKEKAEFWNGRIEAQQKLKETLGIVDIGPNTPLSVVAQAIKTKRISLTPNLTGEGALSFSLVDRVSDSGSGSVYFGSPSSNFAPVLSVGTTVAGATYSSLNPSGSFGTVSAKQGEILPPVLNFAPVAGIRETGLPTNTKIGSSSLVQLAGVAGLAAASAEKEFGSEGKDITIPRRGMSVSIPGVLGLSGRYSTEQDFNTTTTIDVLGEQQTTANLFTPARTMSEIIAQSYAEGYRKFEGKRWEERAKAEDWIFFAKDNELIRSSGQFILDTKTGAELIYIGSGAKVVEIALQGSNLVGQLSSHGVASQMDFGKEERTVRLFGMETPIKTTKLFTEIGGSVWETGSTPAMFYVAPMALGAVSGAVGGAIGSTGFAGSAAATAATKTTLVLGLSGYSFAEGGKVRSGDTGEQIDWNLGKAVGSGLGTLFAYKVASDVSQGKNPLPLKSKTITLQEGVYKPYTVTAPIKPGTKIPFLGRTETNKIEIPFFAKTITPAKNINVLSFEGFGNAYPLIGKTPDNKIFFGSNVKTDVIPTGLISSGTWADSKTGMKIGGKVLRDFYIKQGFETKESASRIPEIANIAKLIYRKEVPIKTSIDEIGKLNPENKPYAEFMAKSIRKYDSLAYGSQSSKLQGGLPGKRLPADFDTYTKENWLKFAFGGKPKAVIARDDLVSGLNKIALDKKTGDIFRVSKESDLLIEIVAKGGQTRHFVDMHTEGYLASLTQPGQPEAPGTGFGLGDARRTYDTKGTKISSLGEESVAKLRSVAGATETGFGPQAHRVEKDIGDAFNSAAYSARYGDKFTINRIIDKITFKPAGKDYQTVTQALSSIANKLPVEQANALAAYNTKFGAPSNIQFGSLGSSASVVGFAAPSISSGAGSTLSNNIVQSPTLTKSSSVQYITRPSSAPSLNKRISSPSMSPYSSSASVASSLSRPASPSKSQSIVQKILSSVSPPTSRSTSVSVSSSLSSLSSSVSVSSSLSSLSSSASVSSSLSSLSSSVSVSSSIPSVSSPFNRPPAIITGGGGLPLFPLFTGGRKKKPGRTKAKSKYKASAFAGLLGYFGKKKKGTQTGFGLRPVLLSNFHKKKKKRSKK